MSNFIMNITGLAQPIPAVDFDNQKVSSKEGPSFSQYIERKCVEQEREGKNMLGVKSREAGKPVMPGKENKTPRDLETQASADLLRGLILKLKEFAQDNKETGAGEWQLSDLEPASLEKLAEAAGLDPTQFGIVNLKLDEQNGILPLLDLLTVLEKHFLQVNDEHPVTAPETSLPLLQTFLEKFGIPVEKVERVAEASVNGLGEFDLALLLKGLEELGNDDDLAKVSDFPTIPLTEWEGEQLQDLLANAGLSDEMQDKFFPNSSASLRAAIKSLIGKEVEIPAGTDSLTKLNFDNLTNMLRQTIADAEAAVTKVDLPVVLLQLEDIIGQAAFRDKGVGWNPVVQESVAAIFQELQKIIDHVKIKIENLSGIQAQEKELLREWQLTESLDERQLTENPDVWQLSGKDGGIVAETGASSLSEEENIVIGHLVNERGPDSNTLIGKGQTDNNMAYMHQAGSDGSEKIETADSRPVYPRFRMSQEMQNFTLDQLSQTVLRGLKNSQHHLTLTLYPKEMGEVKVDMQVKNNLVSLSFLMENPKVKELLEGNMQEFRNSMEQRGFVLEGCNVSVGQEDDGDAYPKQFELAKTWQSESDRRTMLAEIRELLASGQSASLSYHEGVINMMV